MTADLLCSCHALFHCQVEYGDTPQDLIVCSAESVDLQPVSRSGQLHPGPCLSDSSVSMSPGKWRVGVKHVFQLVPSGLQKRIKEYRRKHWDEQQAECVATAWADLSAASKASDSRKSTDARGKLLQRKMKEEHQTRTELLKDMPAKYEDTGRLMVVVTS